MISTLVLLAVIGLTVVRWRRVTDFRYRYSWMASVAAIIGLACLGLPSVFGFELSQRDLDSWLGGVNAVWWLMHAAATTGLWFMRDATRIAFGKGPRPAWILIVLLVAQTGLFAAIPDHHADVATYVDATLQYWQCLAWLVVYMGGLLLIALDAGLAPASPGSLFVRTMRFGYFAIATSCVVNFGYLLIGHVEHERTAVGAFLLSTFNAIFYPALALLVALFITSYVVAYAPLLRVLGAVLSSASDRRPRVMRWLRTPQPHLELFPLVVVVRDEQAAGLRGTTGIVARAADVAEERLQLNVAFA